MDYDKLADAINEKTKAVIPVDLAGIPCAYDRILRVSRTIADLEASPEIQARHVKEAVGYRNLDRADWGE